MAALETVDDIRCEVATVSALMDAALDALEDAANFAEGMRYGYELGTQDDDSPLGTLAMDLNVAVDEFQRANSRLEDIVEGAGR